MRTSLFVLLSILAFAGTAVARDPIDPGLYAMIGDNGQLTGKVMRVTKKAADWQFEDRQPDGSWLDVSCHGGCEHPEADAETVTGLFGSPPPPELQVRCVSNSEYAFCRAVRENQEAYSMVVRVPTESGRLVVNMLRSPNSDTPAAAGDEFL